MKLVLKLLWWSLALFFMASLFLVPYRIDSTTFSTISELKQYAENLDATTQNYHNKTYSKQQFLAIAQQLIDSINTAKKQELSLNSAEIQELKNWFQSNTFTKEHLENYLGVKYVQVEPFISWVDPKTHTAAILNEQLEAYNQNVSRNLELSDYKQNTILIASSRKAIEKYFLSNIIWYYLAFVALVLVTLARIVIIRFQSGEFVEAHFKPQSVYQRVGAYVFGSTLILFYIVLYWFPYYLSEWIVLLDGLSNWFTGVNSNQWFLYGFMYTVVVCVMAVRIIRKYKSSTYHLIRTGSIVFFQLIFAFIIPQVLYALQLPAIDLKNSWPLDYSLFFEYRIQEFIQSGAFGVALLVWSVVLFLIIVPVFTYKYGKRWYCSWVCGCGGLAETAGDTFRHLSDKSKLAHRIEKYLIYSVLAVIVILTVLTITSLFFEVWLPFGFSVGHLQHWYGFLVGAVFAGVVGTGFYPLLGNRVWCRFGCPLAAYMGLVQKFQSKFRITTNGGQCISCGACSVSCEMGIDVRSYAQQKQDIVRASCVGCGVCESVCPRGVLKLENKSQATRVTAVPLQITKQGVLLQHNTISANE